MGLRLWLPLLALSILSPAASAQTIAAERFGLYVVADDVERTAGFYERLFGKPQVRTPALVGFDVAGGLYAVVSRQAYARDARRGDTMRAYIKVKDVEAAFAQVKRVAPASLQSAAVVTDGPFRFFRFADPDGNLVEMFQVTPTPAPPRP